MFILPTPEAVQEMMGGLPEGPFVMLNLYRLRDIADYSAHPELAPPTPVSGRELFERYAAGMERHLAEVGAKRVIEVTAHDTSDTLPRPTAACAEEILAALAKRALRRLVTETAEVTADPTARSTG